MLPDCPKPKDEARIAAARQKFRARNPRRGPPKHKIGPDGKPMIRNKKGAYVLDQKKVRAAQKAEADAKADATAVLQGLVGALTPPAPQTPGTTPANSTPDPAPPVPPTTPSNPVGATVYPPAVTLKAEAIRQVLFDMVHKHP